MITRLIYLHGFNSSPGSYKAYLVAEYLKQQSIPLAYDVPELPVSPKAAISHVQALIDRFPDSTALFGSSLGGYYARYLGQTLDLPCVLINPALRPFELLEDYLGDNVNPYTGEHYKLTIDHMRELQALDMPDLKNPGNVMVLGQTGDEVLDYHLWPTELSGAVAWYEGGGNHEFTNFARTLPATIAFVQAFKK